MPDSRLGMYTGAQGCTRCIRMGEVRRLTSPLAHVFKRKTIVQPHRDRYTVIGKVDGSNKKMITQQCRANLPFARQVNNFQRWAEPNNFTVLKVHAFYIRRSQFATPFALRANCSRYILDFVLFSRDGSAYSTEFQDIDSLTRASLRALLSRVRKRSTKLIAALPFAFETCKRANPFAKGAVCRMLRNYLHSVCSRNFDQVKLDSSWVR